ncbi:MAG: hypothetical protein QOD30_1760 [Actinomycetota bacterium]|jgi:anti-anti-sigma regulatory factor|nr:hypothetical protein [Actinomycetota bacterium]
MARGLRIEWHIAGLTTFATLVGTIDAATADQVVDLSDKALDVQRLVIDLEFVNAIDERGVILLEDLSQMHNVAVVNLSRPVLKALESLGRLGF